MKVKVSPDYEGAGSWETDAVFIAGRWRDESTHVEYPASWCEAIPEITPEPGDICETDAGDIFLVEAETDGRFYDERGIGYDRADLRVLARKPLGAIEAHDAINAFFNALMDTDTQSGEVEAYKSFLRAILGTVYGRVDK